MRRGKNSSYGGVLGVGPANPTLLGKNVSNAGPVFVAFGGGKTAEVGEPAIDDAFAGTRRASPPHIPADAIWTQDPTNTSVAENFIFMAAHGGRPTADTALITFGRAALW